jgi:capsular exopolysaccharide synthesis family protein
MNSGEGALEHALRVFKRRKIIILVAVICVPLAAYLVSSSKTKMYTATATLLFESTPEAGETETTREVATEEALARLPKVAAKAADSLGAGTSLGEVLGSIELSAANELANVATISATNESPERAALIANAYSQAYIEFRREASQRQLKLQITQIESNLAELGPGEAGDSKSQALNEQLNKLEVQEALQTGKTSLVQKAEPPGSPSSPKTKRDVLIGLLLGIILGFGLAALIERLDKRVRSVEEIEGLFGLPIIARIPSTKAFRDASIEQMLEAPEAESFRTLRTNLRYLKVNRDLSSILIASPEPNDGKSTVTRGLTGAMVQMGDNAVLVEADLRKESAFRFGAGYVPDGLSGVLAGLPLEEALMQVPVSVGAGKPPRSLTVLPSGPIPPNPSELLEGPRMKEILDELGEQFEMIVIDSPAVGYVSDAMTLVPLVSAILAVGGLGRTTLEDATGFVDQLSLTGSRPLGLIVTMTPAHRSQYNYSRQPRSLLRR